MIITAIQIKRLPDTGMKLRAIASVTLDDLIVIHDIRVLQDNERIFLGMPSKVTKSTGFSDIVHPINSDARQAFERLICSVYKLSIKEEKMYVDVRMKFNETDSVLSQNCEEYESVSSVGDYKSPSTTEKDTRKVTVSYKSDTPKRDYKSNDFVKWLKS